MAVGGWDTGVGDMAGAMDGGPVEVDGGPVVEAVDGGLVEVVVGGGLEVEAGEDAVVRDGVTGGGNIRLGGVDGAGGAAVENMVEDTGGKLILSLPYRSIFSGVSNSARWYTVHDCLSVHARATPCCEQKSVRRFVVSQLQLCWRWVTVK